MLERLLATSPGSLELALVSACDEIARALGADKVDAFIYDASRDTLVALGTSTQALSRTQRRHGLDQLPLANGGRAVEVFRTGVSFCSGRVDEDPDELLGIKVALKVRSSVTVPLEVGGERRGVLMLASLQHDRWSNEHLGFAEAVSRWVGTLARHAELVEEIERSAAARGRQVAAEELITILAHDLRNFVNPVDLRLQIMAGRAEAEGRPRDQHDADKARRALARLTALIGDLLDSTRVERGALVIEPERVDLAALVRDTAATLSTPQHRVECTVDGEIVALMDGPRIRQCLENLITNAIKHSPRNGRVYVHVRRRADPSTSSETATIDVIDEGTGVPMGMIPHLFQRFSTGDSRGSKGGLGIGLFLARRIATLHGGDVTLESGAHRGARFRLTLPLP